MPELNDIIETQHSAPLFLWWQWVLLALSACILIFILSALLKRKQKQGPPPLSLNPLQIAQQQLRSINLDDLDSNRLAIHLSLIVRQYLQRQYSDNALFQTDEEFHARSDHFERLTPNTQTLLKDYLTKVAQHKYAPNPNHPAALETLITHASEVLSKVDTENPIPALP
ncbi:NfeD family protein [Rubritalea tangerina]|uniref:NfeD family protein n=1 Tax=Rubritalea tangerina TaxID=430798 RepID=A0ABW4ZE30_9BACT